MTKTTMFGSGAGIVAAGVAAVFGCAAPAYADVVVGDGTYAIPGDIPAGQYETITDDSDCAFSVDAADGTELFSGGIDKAIRGSGGQIIISIPATAATFTTANCGSWTFGDWVGHGPGVTPPPATGSFGLPS